MTAVPPEQFQKMMASAKPVDFETAGGKDPVVRLNVTDEGKEVVLRVTVSISGVLRVGNDPNTGLPLYNVTSSIAVGLVKSDPKLRKEPVFKESEKGAEGFA